MHANLTKHAKYSIIRAISIKKPLALQDVASDIIRHEKYVTRFGKTDRIVKTSETAFIAPYHRYIHILTKHNKITGDGQVCFSTSFSWPCETLKSQ